MVMEVMEQVEQAVPGQLLFPMLVRNVVRVEQ